MAQTSSPQAAYQLPRAVHSVLTDIVPVGTKFWMAAGERGHILQSLDGQVWQQMPVPLQSNLNSIYFTDETHGWAVGHDASILYSGDGGASWQIQQYLPELDKPLFDIYFKDPQHGIAVGAYGMFYRTSDAGKTWVNEFHLELASEDDQQLLAELKETDPEGFAAEMSSVLPHFNRLYADGTTLYLVGEAGFFAKSQDFGLTWQRQAEFYNGSLFGITRTKALSLIAVGLRGHVFRSTDQGLSWQQITVPSPSTLNSVINDEQGRVYLLGNAGTLLFSDDDGQTFAAMNQQDGKAILNAVVIADQLVLATETGIKTIQLKESKAL
ncbi:WD40/YVTN/BNR-like repeat-containing protein [Rheinheimera riviphila]|nr:YCF48-related protein [Rheinheimera riviphila]